jgi:preprotein translocase subunit YajC
MVILVYFAIIALAFFLLIVLPQRRRANAHRALLASLQVGDEVITIGGILGTIVDTPALPEGEGEGEVDGEVEP